MKNIININSIKRIHPKTGEIFYPHWYEKDECFIMADPKNGSVKHHKKNAIRVNSLDEIMNLLKCGFSLRMRGGESNAVNLISPDSIQINA